MTRNTAADDAEHAAEHTEDAESGRGTTRNTAADDAEHAAEHTDDAEHADQAADDAEHVAEDTDRPRRTRNTRKARNRPRQMRHREPDG